MIKLKETFEYKLKNGYNATIAKKCIGEDFYKFHLVVWDIEDDFVSLESAEKFLTYIEKDLVIGNHTLEEEEKYEINNKTFIISPDHDGVIYKYDVSVITDCGKKYLDSFMTKKEAEDYLKEIERTEEKQK